MIKLISFIILFMSIFGGFVLSHGRLVLLWQPAELIMIFFPMIACIVIGNNISTVKGVLSGIASIVKNTYTKNYFKENLTLMFELTQLYRNEGSLELEKHIDEPEESEIFKKYPKILKDKKLIIFISDNLRLVTSTKFNASDVDAYIDHEIQTHADEAAAPVNALLQSVDILPGLGIVVAVLGVVNTMQFLGASTEEIGEHISAALLGTFFGIFSAYGVMTPLARAIETDKDLRVVFFNVLKVNITSIVHGYSPYVSVEIARKNIPPSIRLSYTELDAALRGEENTT